MKHTSHNPSLKHTVFNQVLYPLLFDRHLRRRWARVHTKTVFISRIITVSIIFLSFIGQKHIWSRTIKAKCAFKFNILCSSLAVKQSYFLVNNFHVNWIDLNRFSSLLSSTMIRILVYVTEHTHNALLSDLTARTECVFNPRQRWGQQGQGSRTLISSVCLIHHWFSEWIQARKERNK